MVGRFFKEEIERKENLKTKRKLKRKTGDVGDVEKSKKETSKFPPKRKPQKTGKLEPEKRGK